MYQHQAKTEPPLPYEEAGTGEPVLFVHGRLNSSRVWTAVAEQLATGFRTILCDLRAETRPFTADHTAKLLQLLNWLGLGRVHVVTHGAAWSWATNLAVQAPGRIASLAVVDPVVPRTEQANAVQESWHLEMLLQWLCVSHGNVVRKPEHASVLAAVVAQQTHSRVAEVGGPPMAPTYGTDLPPLEGVRCPVLAVVGNDATPESKAIVASVFGQVRQFQFSEVAGAIRHTPLEAPNALADHLSNFFPTGR